MNYTPYPQIWAKEKNTSIVGRMIRLGLNEEGKIYRSDVATPFQWVYAIATGGFGCHSWTSGNAIFTHFEGSSERDVLNKKALGIDKSDRWERYWPNIQVADLPEGQVAGKEE